VNKLLSILVREYLATVATRGFIIGAFLPPIMMGLALMVIPLMMNMASPKVEGKIAVIDQSGAVLPRIQQAFDAQAMRDRTAARIKRAQERLGSAAPVPVGADPAAAAAMLPQPQLTIEPLAPDADAEAAKAPILASSGDKAGGPDERIALVVIPAGAVAPPESKPPTPPADGAASEAKKPSTAFQVYVAPKLALEVQEDIRSEVSRAVTDARIEAAGFKPDEVRRLLASPSGSVNVVTREGDRRSNPATALIMPGAFMMLLWISVFFGGQSLLTTTVEEKSSRVMEVLLSAVSPLQLMTGKILGQMFAALTIMVLYAGSGLGALFVFKQDHLLDPLALVYLVVFFVIAFFIIASIMAAVGSAVNDMREAQALMGPIMSVLVIPMILWMPISRNPNSTFAQVCSFVPPINPFIMVVRLAGSEKVPAWQVPVSILVGVLTMLFCAWAAAKVFRVGVLMYGKPPNLRTLIKWVRMA
jgi:ABC-2 type transport system permease protein